MSEKIPAHNLTEVLCGFWFNPNVNVWDSTFFGKYYEKIQPLGYDVKEEQKGVQIKFAIKPEGGKSVPVSEMNEMDSRMVFKNPKNASAILMAANFISFHKLEPYKTWEALIAEQVNPGMETYQKLGLGKEVVQVQALYLNKYTLKASEKLSDYFSFVPSVQDFGNGFENSLVFQSQHELKPNLIQQIKLNAVLDAASNMKNVFLECSCIASAHDNYNWEKLAQQAHDQNNLVFKSITKK